MNLKDYIKEVPDYPKKGISFKDITPLIKDGEAFRYTVDQIAEFAKEKGAELVVGPDARGFIIGCPLAYALKLGFIPVRKEGKLPREVLSQEYSLEYGTNILAIHKSDIKKGTKVIITDDLLATGGTIEATIKLLNEIGAVIVGIAFIIELKDLNGREKIKDYEIKVLESY